jgi:O-antigen/teichoic acid export membrane protein
MLEKLKNDKISIQMKASFWFLVCSVLQKGISVITTPIFTRLLSTAEYGQYNVFNSWLSVISVFVTLNLCSGVYTMGIVKFKDEEEQFTSSLQGLTLLLCFCWTVIYFVFHGFWNHLFQLTTVQMFAMLVLIWTSTSFGFWMTTQRNRYKYKLLIAVTLIESVLNPVVGIVFVTHAEDKVTARILGLMLVELVCYPCFFFVQMKRGKQFYSGKFWKYAVMFNIPLIPHYLSTIVLGTSDRIMIQRMVGESEAGIYSLAYSIAQVMGMVNDSLNKTMSPWIYQKIREKEYQKISGVVYPSLAIVGSCNILLIAIAPEMVAIFAPKEYYDAIYVIVPVAISGFFTYMYLCFAPFEFYYEKRIWTTIGTLTSALINVVLNIICIPVFGYIAAGYTTLVSYTVNALMHYFFSRKVCKTYIDDLKPYNKNVLLLMSVGFLLLGLMFIPLYKHILIRYIFLIAVLAVVFVQRKRFFVWYKDIMKK